MKSIKELSEKTLREIIQQGGNEDFSVYEAKKELERRKNLRVSRLPDREIPWYEDD